jgi:hypothetical protein
MTVRQAKSQREGLRSQSEVESVTLKINRLVNTYTRAQVALKRLKVDPQSWPDITKADLSMKGSFVEENRTGQMAYTLPWFWRRGRSNVTEDIDGNPVLEECKFFILILHGY